MTSTHRMRLVFRQGYGGRRIPPAPEEIPPRDRHLCPVVRGKGHQQPQEVDRRATANGIGRGTTDREPRNFQYSCRPASASGGPSAAAFFRGPSWARGWPRGHGTGAATANGDRAGRSSPPRSFPCPHRRCAADLTAEYSGLISSDTVARSRRRGASALLLLRSYKGYLQLSYTAPAGSVSPIHRPEWQRPND